MHTRDDYKRALALQRSQNPSGYAQPRRKNTTDNATKIAKSQTKLNAMRSERSNFHLRYIGISLRTQAHQFIPIRQSPRTDRPITKKIRQTTRNRTNKNFATPAAVAATPANPKSAATNAIIRKIKAQRSILSPPPESIRMGQSWRVFLFDELPMRLFWRQFISRSFFQSTIALEAL